MNAILEREYRKYRAAGWRPRQAMQYARIKPQWEVLESAGLVRFEARPDELSCLEDLEGDCFNEKVAADCPGGVRAMRAGRKAFIEQIEQDGVWGIIGEYRTSEDENWEHGGSCWGFVGMDDSDFHGYGPDIKAETIDALRKALKARCPTCGRSR